MDFFLELIFELVMQGSVRNPKVKTGIKTAAFLLITEAFVALLLALSLAAPEGRLAGSSLAMVCGIIFLVLAIRGHRRNWEHEQNP